MLFVVRPEYLVRPDVGRLLLRHHAGERDDDTVAPGARRSALSAA